MLTLYIQKLTAQDCLAITLMQQHWQINLCVWIQTMSIHQIQKLTLYQCLVITRRHYYLLIKLCKLIQSIPNYYVQKVNHQDSWVNMRIPLRFQIKHWIKIQMIHILQLAKEHVYKSQKNTMKPFNLTIKLFRIVHHFSGLKIGKMNVRSYYRKNHESNDNFILYIGKSHPLYIFKLNFNKFNIINKSISHNFYYMQQEFILYWLQEYIKWHILKQLTSVVVYQLWFQRRFHFTK
ncbi:unnamed protein product [Paramecium octaurelia]|uniref:Uncharacterized protein n=1 Tax=Paramecium octaurelia TaxID=43137 RepID=A0A8S1U2F4_PAROT|nr:unnamed protein product [Paramecium octaurelia]